MSDPVAHLGLKPLRIRQNRLVPDPAVVRIGGQFHELQLSRTEAGVPTSIKSIALNRAVSDQGDDGDQETDERLPEGSPDDEHGQTGASGVYQPHLPISLRLVQKPP
jgi:hypothetical protein